MDIRSILTAILSLAVFGLVILIGLRVAGATAGRAAAAL